MIPMSVKADIVIGIYTVTFLQKLFLVMNRCQKLLPTNTNIKRQPEVELTFIDNPPPTAL